MKIFKRIEVSGEYGYDFNDNLTTAGAYELPMLSFDPETCDEELVYTKVNVTDVLRGRFQVVVGYDEDNNRAMWYCNSGLFKRVEIEDWFGNDYTSEDIYEYLTEDANIEETLAKTIADKFVQM